MTAFAGGELVARDWRYFENLTALEEVGSSQDLARELIDLYFEEDLALPPSVIVAESQPSARGRRGAWIAPGGRGLYFTFVRPIGEGEPATLLPLSVSRWVGESLASAAGTAIGLKWPNDLYVGRRKLAGVLAESRTQGEDSYVAVGVGINVLGSAAPAGVELATTIERESGRRPALAPLLQTILDRLDAELAGPRWSEEVKRWEAAAVHRRGDLMRVRREGGEVAGRYLGLSAEGFLRLETPSGETVVPAGEVAEW